jgi:hypothetical protein
VLLLESVNIVVMSFAWSAWSPDGWPVDDSEFWVVPRPHSVNQNFMPASPPWAAMFVNVQFPGVPPAEAAAQAAPLAE